MENHCQLQVYYIVLLHIGAIKEYRNRNKTTFSLHTAKIHSYILHLPMKLLYLSIAYSLPLILHTFTLYAGALPIRYLDTFIAQFFVVSYIFLKVSHVRLQ